MSLTLRQIAETAALTSARAMLLIESRQTVPDSCLHNYWKCCRGRLIDWLHTLDELEGQATVAEDEAEHLRIWNRATPILSEIFVTELLTRVWATVLTAMDLQNGQDRAAPVVKHTFHGHVEARNQAARLMLSSLRVPLEEVARFDRLRRKCERWSDLLIGHLVLNYQLEEFAFETSRSLDFGQTQLREILHAADEPVWEFVTTGIRLSFHEENQVPPSDVWNRGIVRSVLSSFPTDCFDDSGPFRSLLRTRIERGSSNADRAQPAPKSTATNEPVTQNQSRIRFSDLRQRYPHQ